MPRNRPAESTPLLGPWPRPAKIAFIGSHGIRKTSALLAFAAEVQRAGRSVELGREVGVPMRLANLALAEMTEALNRGWGERDSSSFMQLEEERAGVKIAVPPARLREMIERDGA